jgi:predicted Zn-dependent protease
MIEAQIREARRDLAGAAGEYQAELDTDPANLLAQRNLAACVFKLGRFDQARGVLERYVASVPTDPMAWGMLTRAYAELGRAADALRSAEATAKLAPKNADFQRNLGLLQAVSGHLPEAIVALTRAAKIAPSDAGTRIELARVLARAGRTKEALGALDAALALRPGDPDALRLKQSLLAGGGAQGG